MTFDLAILGGGPGGYVAAGKAGAAGLSVVLFEKKELGGVCLNEGCIPSKALLNSAKTYEHALHAQDYGVSCAGVTIDQKAVIARKARVVRTLVSGVKGKMKAAGVTVVMEEATIQGKEGEAFVVSAGGKTYGGKQLIVATGSSNAVPPLPGLRENLGDFKIETAMPDGLVPAAISCLRENPGLLLAHLCDKALRPLFGQGVLDYHSTGAYSTLEALIKAGMVRYETADVMGQSGVDGRCFKWFLK